MIEYRVFLLANEYTGLTGPGDVWVRSFAKRGEALAFVKGSGYVADLEAWVGRARWQACYRIERIDS